MDDDDVLMERINRIYDDLHENGLMQDMSRDEHETLMLSIAYDFRELESRERIFMANPSRYNLASWIYRQICILLDNCEAKYEIHFEKDLTLSGSISIVVITESLDISSKNMAPLKEILKHIDWFTLWPGSGDRVRMSFDIHDVYIELGEDGQPIISPEKE